MTQQWTDDQYAAIHNAATCSQHYFDSSYPSLPVRMTRSQAQAICDEELSQSVTDWDRYADAWWRIQELDAVKSKRVKPKANHPLHIISVVSGLIVTLYECFAASTTSPVMLVMASVLMLLPAMAQSMADIVDDVAPILLYALCVVGFSQVMVKESHHLQQRAKVVRSQACNLAKSHLQLLQEAERATPSSTVRSIAAANGITITSNTFNDPTSTVKCSK